ncbi:hypothetical protein D3C76_980450 [compost metagenome]
MERCAELVDVGHDLAVAGIGENHQRNLVGDFRQAGRYIRVRAPGWHGVVIELTFFAVGNSPALASACQGRLENFVIRPPVTHDLVQAIGREILDELIHLLRWNAVSEQLARHRAHVEIGQRTVAVERNEFGAKKAH